ncbi:hypothetical protein OG824_13480 [Streptomyces prunicolor]|uniref:hypothetical protein n=1 Tax=Streptomyces prunicolor TaxID=67348 RepID=UPI00225B8941|nr:hypothetical protein [Streptomyces prunicolor]MCX5236213.1 hypothetical protein [Streptomyces prunicolor]
MKVEREVYEYEIADGKMFVLIHQAKRNIVTDWQNGNQKVEKILPRVMIGTDLKFQGLVDEGHVKVRGRRYTTQHTYERLDDSQGKLDRHGIVMRWTTDTTHYNRGYRNDRGKQIEYDAKAHGTLRDLEVEVLKRFEKEHPEWKTESIRALFEWERDNHASRARDLRRQAEEQEAAAAKWQARIDEMTA